MEAQKCVNRLASIWVDLTHEGLTMIAGVRYATDWTLIMGHFARVAERRGVLIAA